MIRSTFALDPVISVMLVGFSITLHFLLLHNSHPFPFPVISLSVRSLCAPIFIKERKCSSSTAADMVSSGTPSEI
jgi:hypothetical protein